MTINDLNINPYDVVKLEAFHTICTAVSKVVLSRQVDQTTDDGEDMPAKDLYIPNLQNSINNSLIDNLPSGDGFLEYENKDLITDYVEDVISTINHPLYDLVINDNNGSTFLWQNGFIDGQNIQSYRTTNEQGDFTTYMETIATPLLKNIAREMVDNTLDFYFDTGSYANSIKKSRSLLSSVNLKMNEVLDNNLTLTLEGISDKLFTIRGFNIPTDIIIDYTSDNVIHTNTLDPSNNIHLYLVGDMNCYNFLVWSLPIDISNEIPEDYPSISQYDIIKLHSEREYQFISDEKYIGFSTNKNDVSIQITDSDGIRNVGSNYFYNNPVVEFPDIYNEYSVLVTEYDFEYALDQETHNNPSTQSIIDSPNQGQGQRNPDSSKRTFIIIAN